MVWVLAVTMLMLDLPAGAGAVEVAPPSENPYVALAPSRILDTRTGLGGVRRSLGPGETRDALVLGVGGVPATGVAAVVLNVTAVGATADTFVTGWPTGLLRPTASALNPRPGGAFPNLVVAQVGQRGRISLFNEAGTVELLADVVGYHTDPSSYPVSCRRGSWTPGRDWAACAEPSGPMSSGTSSCSGSAASPPPASPPSC